MYVGIELSQPTNNLYMVSTTPNHNLQRFNQNIRKQKKSLVLKGLGLSHYSTTAIFNNIIKTRNAALTNALL